MDKESSFYVTQVNEDIKNKILQDMSLSYSQRNSLISMVNKLDAHKSSELLNVLRTAGGAGAGYAVAKYLFDMGFTCKVIMSLIGAFTAGLFNNNIDKPQDTLYGLNRNIF